MVPCCRHPCVGEARWPRGSSDDSGKPLGCDARDQGYKRQLPLQRLQEELRLHKCSTRECIEQFYLDKLKQVGLSLSTQACSEEPASFAGFFHWPFPQRSLEQNRFGRLTVRCHYEAAEQRLAVEVLHAADLLPLDANGEAQQRQLGVDGVLGAGRHLAPNVSSRPK